MMRMRLALVLVTLFQGGCVVVYVPDPARAATRGAIEDADLKDFQLDVTTREETLLALGEPDEASDDGTVLMYWWYRHRGFLLWMVAAPNGVGAGWAGMVGTRVYLSLKFDESGRVTRHKFIHVSEGGSGPIRPQPTPREMLTQW